MNFDKLNKNDFFPCLNLYLDPNPRVTSVVVTLEWVIQVAPKIPNLESPSACMETIVFLLNSQENIVTEYVCLHSQFMKYCRQTVFNIKSDIVDAYTDRKAQFKLAVALNSTPLAFREAKKRFEL